jgi:hypothetical protein
MQLAKYNSGQALITLIFYVIIISVVTTAAVLLLLLNIQSSEKMQDGVRAYFVAESGAENALLRVLRDPSYTGESNLAVGLGTATIAVTPGNSIEIISTGYADRFVRKIRVRASFINGYYTITSWEEIE